MTRTANARLAGFMFLFYIAVGILSMVLFSRASGGTDPVARLASIAAHDPLFRVTILLTLAQFVAAVVLGVTLYSLTRDEDRDVALLALCCRLTEGILGAAAAVGSLELLKVALASVGTDGGAMAARNFGSVLLMRGGQTEVIAATCFAFGSTLFSYLFLRARSIPVSLAWLGVAASLLLVVVLPLRIAGIVHGTIIYYVWIPMAVFEIALAFWLMIKGVRPPLGATI